MPKAFVKLGDDVVQMSATKPSEDGKGIVIRLYEPTGKPHKTTLCLPFCGVEHEVSLGAFEIKTLLVDLKEESVVETDLMERRIN